MSEMSRFPIVTVIMVIVTFLFIVMYMITSNVFFYSDSSIKVGLEKAANETMSDPFYRNAFLNNSVQQKLFFQYGMVTSVCLTPVCAVLEMIIGRRKARGE